MSTLARPNSWVSQDDASNTQLTYALQLNPAPLTVSISGRDPVLGSLQFVLTNSTASSIAVTSVEFTIQVGTTSSDLTPSTANVDTSLSDSTNWQIQSPGVITSGPATYTLQPATGSSVSIAAGASVVVEIFNFPANQNPGNSTIAIKEVAGTIGFTNFQVTTFPTGFYFNGLSTTIATGSQLVPVAQVGAGASITLVWNSSIVDLGSITIYYSNAAQGQQKSTPAEIGLWTSPALTTDTIFTVVVTVSVAGGSPLTAALATSVSIQNPALIAASITAGQAAVSGPTTLTGSLSVTGASNVGSLNANALGVSGASNLASLSINNALSVLGLATLTGGMQLGGTLAALQAAVSIQPGSYGAAPTDGFISGFTTYPWNTPGPITPPYFTLVSATSGGVSQQAFTVTVPQLDGLGNFQSQVCLSGSFLLPVQKGNTFEVSMTSTPNITPYVLFYWIPLGVASSPAQMAALRLGDANPTDKNVVTHPRDK